MPIGGFSVTSFNLGTATVTGTGTGTNPADVTFVKIQPATATTDAVEWTVKPSAGLTFTPTKVSGYIQRFATDAKSGVTVSAKLADGTTVKLGTYTAPRNNKTQDEDKNGKASDYAPQFDITLTSTQQQQLTSSDGFTLSATIGVASGKQGGFSDIHIEGLLNGTVKDVAKYTLSATASPTEGGVVEMNPEAEQYEEGTEVKLSATKNFGYKFVNWTDASGNVVSTDASFAYTMNANAALTANFQKLNTYSLTYGVEGGAKDYMVSLDPEPTVVEGKNMYEEGTKVKLIASSNKIMTFTGWSSGETLSEITLTMNQDHSLTADYSASDFVAAWDFILSGNNGRVADFAAADNEADALILRNADGDVQSWLDKSNEKGGYEGRNAAVNWLTKGLGEYYWQTMVNAAAFTDIKVSSAMMYNYNAYNTYNLQYSVDGTTWTTVGSFKLEGAKKWNDKEISLPEAANNQATLYLRWIADKTSSIAGTTSNNDGIALSDIFITGTAKIVDDGTAPVLQETVPAEGATTATANGKIVLKFDEKVKVAENASATLGTQTLTPTVSGKSVIFEYKGLDYATAYTFTLPANSVADLTDNYVTEAITINFTTKTRPAVTKALYDFVVPNDGTFKEAIAAADARADKTVRYRIFVKKGSYLLPYSETEVITNSAGVSLPNPITYLNSSNVSIIGENMDETVIKNDMKDITAEGTAYPIEGLHNVTTLYLNKNVTGTYLQDITLKNGMNDATGCGEALEDNGDKTICKDVCLYGYQDTYCSNNQNGRFYFEGGRLRGRTDFLCGKGDIYFNSVELMMCQDGGYIAVPSAPKKYGYIFKDCTVNAEKSGIDGKYYLGRPWGSGTPTALYIDTKMNAKPSAIGWAEMSNGWPARFAEYNSMTASGTTIDLSGRKNTFGDNHTNNPVLTANEAAGLTIETVMGGDDDWDPTAYTEQSSAPTNVKLNGTTLTWDNSDYVLCWAVCKDGSVVAFTTAPTYTVDDATATYSVRAANEMGGLGDAAKVGETTSIGCIAIAGESNATIYNVKGMIADKNAKGLLIKYGKKYIAK